MKDDKGVKEEEVQLPEEPPTLKETTEEVPAVTEEPAGETEQVETETAESGKGANQRIRELNQQKKVAEERAQSLADRLAEITKPIGLREQFAPQVSPPNEERQEVTVEEVLRTADARTELKIRQNDAVNRITNESIDAVRKYSQLDPESEDFDPELSETVTEATEAMVRANPYSASVSKFVDKLMKPYLGSVSKEVGKQTENIAKQVSDAALRPTSIRKQEKPASEKTIAELEQELGIVQA